MISVCASKRRMRETNVNQKPVKTDAKERGELVSGWGIYFTDECGKGEFDEPGPVLVVIPDPSLFISCLRSAKSAISMANAMRVNNAAKNASKDAIRVTTRWVEREKRNAKNMTTVATSQKKNCVRCKMIWNDS